MNKKDVKPDMNLAKAAPTRPERDDPGLRRTLRGRRCRFMSANENSDIAARAAELYAPRAILAEARPEGMAVGVSDIVLFLGSGRAPSAEAQRALFASPRLRADYRRLKSQLSMFELPALAAASDGQVTMRRFEGGAIRIHPSRVAGQTYVLVRFDAPDNAPAAMVLEHPSGEVVRRALSIEQSEGEALLLLDSRLPEDEAFLRVLCDPKSTGGFLMGSRDCGQSAILPDGEPSVARGSHDPI